MGGIVGEDGLIEAGKRTSRWASAHIPSYPYTLDAINEAQGALSSQFAADKAAQAELSQRIVAYHNSPKAKFKEMFDALPAAMVSNIPIAPQVFEVTTGVDPVASIAAGDWVEGDPWMAGMFLGLALIPELGVLDDFARPAAKVARSSGNPEMITFFHGTSREFASEIRSTGINLARSRPDLDFGRGFYLTENYEHAMQMATRTARRLRSEPVVLAFEVPVENLNVLSNRIFGMADAEWTEFVRLNRSLGPMHDFDVMTGPLARNLRTLEAFPYPAWSQTSIHTQAAVDLFNLGLK